VLPPRASPCSASLRVFALSFSLPTGARLAPVAARFTLRFFISAACAARSARRPRVLPPAPSSLLPLLLLLLACIDYYYCSLFLILLASAFAQPRSLSVLSPMPFSSPPPLQPRHVSMARCCCCCLVFTPMHSSQPHVFMLSLHRKRLRFCPPSFRRFPFAFFLPFPDKIAALCPVSLPHPLREMK